MKPHDLECVLWYCDNPTTSPNVPHNYNYNWNGNVVRLDTFISYPCKPNYAIEVTDKDYKEGAPTQTSVKCGNDGEFAYPSPWPQCSITITCEDPGNSTGVTRQYVTTNTDLDYDSELRYTCDDPRRWIKLTTEADTALAAYRDNRCQWKKTYEFDGTDRLCLCYQSLPTPP